MFLESISIKNFRKFGCENNKVNFADASNYDISNENELNVASKTTLIVGKNNSGKTTIIDALDILVNTGKKFKGTDFNFQYVKSLLDFYFSNKDKINEKLPEITIKIDIVLNDEEDKDIYSCLYPVLTIDDIINKRTSILIKYLISESRLYVNKISKLLENDFKDNEQLKFDKFIQIINDTDFSIKYYNSNNEEIKEFNISNIIELKYIRANNLREEKCLTKAFSKLIKYRNITNEISSSELNNNIDNVNYSLTSHLDEQHTQSINDVLIKIIDDKKCKVKLKADLTVDELLTNVVHYYFNEKDVLIPENQFGLGYTNLIMIIAEILNYVEKYPNNKYNDHINLIAIEEPETFMHPQMQELFIKHINDIVFQLLSKSKKNINCQLIITTHSAHILNSKIGAGGTFNNINYIREKNGFAYVVALRDENVASFTKKEKQEIEKAKNEKKFEDLAQIEKYCQFEFIKKHIKYNVSEVFFSDAIIFVEGPSEYVLLKYYIDKIEELKTKYISVVLINGAFAKMYDNLIKVLNIPTLIITDIDIVRDKDEIKDYKQIISLKERETSNKTIIKYNNNSSNLENCDYFVDQNIKVVFQKDSIIDFYSTSFEEAFILTNKDSDELGQILQEMHSDLYKEIGDKTKIASYSYHWQRSLSNDKTRFANEILYKEITSGSGNILFELPKYIQDGLEYLKEQLNGK